MRNTGGSRGIGLAIARRLAASRDYNVIALARREGEQLATAVREAEGRLHFRSCDLALIDAIRALARSVRAQDVCRLHNSAQPPVRCPSIVLQAFSASASVTNAEPPILIAPFPP
ncbi:SDR family NAD(P)-dependent oxidoreductase [Bradyrhizobium sp. CB1717]|uniref:SDR family NAD(P)-dependent oxidoreductase n=1 Tax=Bradyrhizobium sp. CB1717 TaxID=3039154 RepID=UPI0024B18C30|nr:SDR family NAD(P)-dependent oxidoreductase [Bradyrhizobium sp. CB1717]WFU22154.1 SDR family NAD(P)-dependent oxidoreductase [Bradyrhizobium sp. CB1717]